MSYLGNAKSVQALTVYEVWRDRFLRDRLRPAVGIAIFFAFTITVYFLGERFFAHQEFESVYLYTSAAVELGLLTCFVFADCGCTAWASCRTSRGITNFYLDFSVFDPSYADPRPLAPPPDFSTRRFVLPRRDKFGFKSKFC